MRYLNKMILENRYPDEASMGIYYADSNTGYSELEHTMLGSSEYNEVAFLSNGKQMGKCTNIAHWIVDDLGEGQVYGFSTDENPVEHHSVDAAGGHDFAVIRGRYIVDPWISHYTGDEEQTVFDMKSLQDQEKIREIYGDPKLWAIADKVSGEFIKHDDPKFPQNLRMDEAGLQRNKLERELTLLDNKR